MTELHKLCEYTPPEWVVDNIPAANCPTHRINLGQYPTPLHACPHGVPIMQQLQESHGVTFYLKRDDLSSFELSGNKLRKLEFLLAEAVLNKHDSVVTVGGLQSNHAKTTAMAVRQIGLEPYLLLRMDGYSSADAAKCTDPGMPGNLLMDRLCNATITTCTVAQYHKFGSPALLDHLGKQLREREGRNPYLIPVGGSNVRGTWGYLHSVEELRLQLAQLPNPAGTTTHVVFACGSGGTAAGLAIGCKLAGLLSPSAAVSVKLHGVCVCDTPDDFYQHIDREATEIFGLSAASVGFSARECLSLYQGKGALGYAKMSDEDLQFLLLQAVLPSGIVFDHCYSGKAMNYLLRNIVVEQGQRQGQGQGQVDAKPPVPPAAGAASSTDGADRAIAVRSGDRVVFLHTGGALGMYERTDQVSKVLAASAAAAVAAGAPATAGATVHSVRRIELE